LKNPIASTSDIESAFVELFAFVATIDNSPYMVIPKALEFRQAVCGGEAYIREYCRYIAQIGGAVVADILGTAVMDNKAHTLQQCCFANVRLPLQFRTETGSSKKDGLINVTEAPHLVRWIMERAVKEFATYLPTKFHAGALWVRLSGQIYLEAKDFVWAGHVLKGLCDIIMKGEGRAEAIH
jgi:hercynylcysteine S-oxide lyase